MNLNRNPLTHIFQRCENEYHEGYGRQKDYEPYKQVESGRNCVCNIESGRIFVDQDKQLVFVGFRTVWRLNVALPRGLIDHVGLPVVVRVERVLERGRDLERILTPNQPPGERDVQFLSQDESLWRK